VKPVKARVTGRLVTGGIQAGGSGIAYARIHELGGITGAVKRRFYLNARPYLRPVVEKNLPEIERSMIEQVILLEQKLGLR
jgi:phage gpG-like protein